MINNDLIIPTRNLTDVAPECEGVLHVNVNTPRESEHFEQQFCVWRMNTCLLLSKV